MTTYVIAPNGTFDRKAESGNILWDSTHFQPVETLTSEEMTAFGVFPLTETAPPTFNRYTQTLTEADPAPVNGVWTQQWTVTDMSSEELVAALAARKASMVASVLGLRATKLAAGFDYNFNDARGVHRIGTTDVDEVGWDKVSKLAGALMALGQTTATIDIVTNTGPTTVTAAEWQSVLIAGGQFGQPIYTQSFTLEAEIEAAATSADLDAIDINVGW